MGIFKSKAEKDFERKQKIKQQIRDFERRIIKLEEQIKKHIESAREAVRENLPEQVAHKSCINPNDSRTKNDHSHEN